MMMKLWSSGAKSPSVPYNNNNNNTEFNYVHSAIANNESEARDEHEVAKKEGGRSVSSIGIEKRRLIERFEEKLVTSSRFPEHIDEIHERR